MAIRTMDLGLTPIGSCHRTWSVCSHVAPQQLWILTSRRISTKQQPYAQ